MTKVVGNTPDTDEAKNGQPVSPRDRATIRAAILNSKPKSVVIKAFGFELEVRQPAVGVVLGMPTGDENRAKAMAAMLCNFVYVPGTDQKVFEPEDADAITAIPFSEDLQKIADAVNDLTGTGRKAVDDEAKNSNGTDAG